MLLAVPSHRRRDSRCRRVLPVSGSREPPDLNSLPVTPEPGEDSAEVCIAMISCLYLPGHRPLRAIVRLGVGYGKTARPPAARNGPTQSEGEGQEVTDLGSFYRRPGEPRLRRRTRFRGAAILPILLARCSNSICSATPRYQPNPLSLIMPRARLLRRIPWQRTSCWLRSSCEDHGQCRSRRRSGAAAHDRCGPCSRSTVRPFFRFRRRPDRARTGGCD